MHEILQKKKKNQPHTHNQKILKSPRKFNYSHLLLTYLMENLRS